MTSTTSMTATSTTKRQPNQWIQFVKAYRAENPTMTWKQCLTNASPLYQEMKTAAHQKPASAVAAITAKPRQKALSPPVIELQQPAPSGTIMIPTSTPLQPPQSPSPITLRKREMHWKKKALMNTGLPRLVLSNHHTRTHLASGPVGLGVV